MLSPYCNEHIFLGQRKKARNSMEYRFTYATRLNSFAVKPELFWKSPKSAITAIDLLRRASHVRELTHIEFNYPQHIVGSDERVLLSAVQTRGLQVSGFGMRYPLDVFRNGIFINPSLTVRNKAVDLTIKGVESMLRMGGRTMTLWLSTDGFEHPFQIQYSRAVDLIIKYIRKIARAYPGIRFSIEYKPRNPRAVSVMPNMGTALFFVRQIALPNIGVTMDFSHSLCAGEYPPFQAFLALKEKRLFGIHLNDSYGVEDDGLMVGSVHPMLTQELIQILVECKYDTPLYFDTFSKNIDPVTECRMNIRKVKHIVKQLSLQQLGHK